MEKLSGLNYALAKVIREAREAKGLTQGQLAGFAGLSEIYLSSLERGYRGDSINALLLMANVLGIPASDLMRQIEEELRRGVGKPATSQGRPRKRNEEGKR